MAASCRMCCDNSYSALELENTPLRKLDGDFSGLKARCWGAFATRPWPRLADHSTDAALLLNVLAKNGGISAAVRCVGGQRLLREDKEVGAVGGNRTHTVFKHHWILSPARLPVPPRRHRRWQAQYMTTPGSTQRNFHGPWPSSRVEAATARARFAFRPGLGYSGRGVRADDCDQLIGLL